MRACALLVLVVGLAAAPSATAQPSVRGRWTGWRAAAAAALAFGHAEGKGAALGRYTIGAGPANWQAAATELDKLDRVAQEAREAYAFVERYGSPFWTAAAELRIGDTFECQAEKIVAIPLPPQIASLPAGTPPKVRAQYLEVLDGLVKPLRDQALVHWERAAGAADGSRVWSARARARLAGTTLPDC